MKKLLGDQNVHVGMNATGDSFYGSQGRVTKDFDDRNQHLIEIAHKKYPKLLTLEMETFHLFDMSETSFGRLKCASATLVLAQRKKVFDEE
jgi:uridine phosphorylase